MIAKINKAATGKFYCPVSRNAVEHTLDKMDCGCCGCGADEDANDRKGGRRPGPEMERRTRAVSAESHVNADVMGRRAMDCDTRP